MYVDSSPRVFLAQHILPPSLLTTVSRVLYEPYIYVHIQVQDLYWLRLIVIQDTVYVLKMRNA